MPRPRAGEICLGALPTHAVRRLNRVGKIASNNHLISAAAAGDLATLPPRSTAGDSPALLGRPRESDLIERLAAEFFAGPRDCPAAECAVKSNRR